MNVVLPIELVLTVGFSIAVFTLGCFIWGRARVSPGSLTFGLLAMCLALWTSADWFLHLQSTALPSQILIWKILFYLSVFFAPGFVLRIAAHVARHVKLQSSILAYFCSLFGFGVLAVAFVLREYGYDSHMITALFTVGSILGIFLYVMTMIIVGMILYPALWSHRSLPIVQRQASYAIVLLIPFLLAGGLQLISGPIPTGLLMPILCCLFIFISLLAFLRSNFLDVHLSPLEAFFVPLISCAIVVLMRARDLSEFIAFFIVCVAIGIYGVLAIQSLEEERKKRILSEETMFQLKRLDEARHDFVNMVAHQLRTPLAGIRGAASMLEAGDFGTLPKPAIEATLKISELAERLTSLSETFLNASRIEMGAFSSKQTTVCLEEILRTITREVEVPVQTKGLFLKIQFASNLTQCYQMDKEVFQNALFNLVDNAVKYTSHGGVRVEIMYSTGSLHVVISDTGQGMDSDDVHCLFQKFHRGEIARKSDKDGTGLGLYVVRQLVEAVGGRVTGESDGVGKGSTFRLTLPAHQIDDTLVER
ncbi:hypothetical protein IT408_04640 [Candidatus Uhrbacteria bacterium]|nr:hypothetical protein [Candidatus Uhrbacteria bacterium]